MIASRKLILGGVVSWLIVAGCENAEEKVRYVKAPLESADVTDRTSLNRAVSESRTRLASVRSAVLRTNLSAEIDEEYERALKQIRQDEEEQARKALEAEREREAERQRAAAAALEAEKIQEEREKAALAVRPAKRESESDQIERRRAAVEAYRERTKDAVTELEVGVRESALGDGTKVLVLRNLKPYPANFDLRCYTRDDLGQKTFSLIVPAHGEKRVGFVQGWCGNFKQGERCEAYVDGELMWEYKVPTF